MVLKQTTMKLSKTGVVTGGPPEKVLKMVFLWKIVGLAIHKSTYIADKGLWTISHYNSGRSVIKYIKTKVQAVECLPALYDILGDWTFTEEEWVIQADETKKDLKIYIDELQQRVLEGRV